MVKKKDDNYVAVGGILLPATPDLKKVEKANKDFLEKAKDDPVMLDMAMRAAAGEAVDADLVQRELPPLAIDLNAKSDLVKKTEALLEVLPVPDPEEVKPTIGREELMFLDEMFRTPENPVPDLTGTVTHNPPKTKKYAILRNEAPVKSTGGSTSYYEIPEDATELNDLIEHKEMGFALGNIFKACYRLGEKADTDLLYDINKMIFFAERLKKYVEKNGKLP